MGGVQSVDEYLAGFSGESRELLERLRELAGEAAPEADEAIKWGYPAWVHRSSGTILFMISGHKKHAGAAFTPSTREAFDAEVAPYAPGKGTIKLAYGQPIPDDLLRRMMTYRVREHEDDGVLWM